MSTFRGRAGEQAAAEYLEKIGYKILKRNFKGPRGEVDIINSKGNILVFTEVKTYIHSPAETLEFTLGRRKQMRITETARYFLGITPEYGDSQVRFDLILVSGSSLPVHYENAFTEFGVS